MQRRGFFGRLIGLAAGLLGGIALLPKAAFKRGPCLLYRGVEIQMEPSTPPPWLKTYSFGSNDALDADGRLITVTRESWVPKAYYRGIPIPLPYPRPGFRRASWSAIEDVADGATVRTMIDVEIPRT